MGRHLNEGPWMRKTTTGTWMLKRVSAERAERFPRKYRQLWRDKGPVLVVKQLMLDKGMTLAQAWEDMKRMVNG